MRVIATTIDARSVFNLASPRFLPELARCWQGSRGWWDDRYEPLRDLCERRYIELFNQRTGHYARLEESIRAEGIRNPVMLSCGMLERRRPLELPPAIRARGDVIACEYVGGSRVTVAARLGIALPAIINDYAAVIVGGTEILSGDTTALLAFFKDAPNRAHWRHNGSVYVNSLPAVHYHPAQRLEFTVQQRTIRAEIISRILIEVQEWREQHDNA